MRVFVTGATGFIGSAVVEELMEAGHTVTALARSGAAAKALSAKGIQPHRGDLNDLESLREASAAADGVIHLAFKHGLGQASFPERLRILFGGLPSGIVSRFMAITTQADRQAINTIGAALKGSGRPLVTTFGTIGLANDSVRATRPATEADEPDPRSAGFARAITEETVEGLASLGVRATMVRLAPTVHGTGDTGFVPQLIGIARKKGQSAYVGDGNNRWPAIHRRDAARLFRLALEKGVAGTRYHGVAEEAIPFRLIADVIGNRLGVPVVAKTATEAAAQFNWLARFVATDNPASSDRTREELGWQPREPALMDDLTGSGYFTA